MLPRRITKENNPPNTMPTRILLALTTPYTALIPFATSPPSGPNTRMLSGTNTIKHKNGTRINCTTCGKIFFSHFSK